MWVNVMDFNQPERICVLISTVENMFLKCFKHNVIAKNRKYLNHGFGGSISNDKCLWSETLDRSAKEPPFNNLSKGKCHSLWPNVAIKRLPKFLKVAWKVAKAVLFKKWHFYNSPISHHINVWATLVRKLVIMTFQKWANLVTLNYRSSQTSYTS